MPNEIASNSPYLVSRASLDWQDDFSYGTENLQNVLLAAIRCAVHEGPQWAESGSRAYCAQGRFCPA